MSHIGENVKNRIRWTIN